jgi:peptide deformylase
MRSLTATKDNIITLPHKNLRARSSRVGFVDSSVLELIKKMEDATIDWENHRDHEVGVALAAVQINEMKRVVIIREDFNDRRKKSFLVFINPEITKFDGEIIEDYEGCLSIKNIYGRVPRYSKVKVKASDIHGKEFRITAYGFLARVFQHEIDHTNGKVFIDHIKNNKDAFYHLDENGKLKKLEYDEAIDKNSLLWE